MNVYMSSSSLLVQKCRSFKLVHNMTRAKGSGGIRWNANAILALGGGAILLGSTIQECRTSDEEIRTLSHCISTNVTKGALERELSDVDGWWESDKERAATFLEDLDRAFPRNPEILWRRGRVIYNIAYELKDLAKKKEMYEAAMEICTQAVQFGDNVSAAHKWYAIVLSELSSTQGTKSSIESAYVVKEHFDHAARLDPTDPNCWHFLGRWSFTIASIGWWSRQIAATIFATPPTSTFEDALAYFEKAEALQPGFWKSNVFFIAKCQLELGDKDKARATLLRAAAMRTASAEDQKTQEEIEVLMKALPE